MKTNDIMERLDVDAFIESIDPDWRDHFLTTDDALMHYKKYMTPMEFKKAAEECLL